MLLVQLGLVKPQLLIPKKYQYISLVTTPPPLNHKPQPVRPKLLPPPPVVPPERIVAEAKIPPAPVLERSKPEVREAPRELTPDPKPIAAVDFPSVPNEHPGGPKTAPVRTDVFSTGSSATPTVNLPAHQVQTGGFGDPNGVPANANSKGRPNIAKLGSFDLPNGQGYGNGTGGAHGARGVVASAGFGNGIAVAGDGSGGMGRGGSVREAGFGDAHQTVQQAKLRAPVTTLVLPVEILSKPKPAYTEEARSLRIEGEVLLEVIFGASGELQVKRVVRGLGHGLDESALRAAAQIRFKPAQRAGQAVDSTAVVHIIFQIA